KCKPNYAGLEPTVTPARLATTPNAQLPQAEALALNAIAEIAQEESAPAPRSSILTLATLADRYERDGFAGPTDAYQRDALAAIRRIAAFLGTGTLLGDVKPSDVQKYVAHRLGQGVTAAAGGGLVALQ